MTAKVYFTDMHVRMGDSLLGKFDRLITRAGIEQIDFKDKFVAVKLHFGEVGNMAFLRQQYARVLCDHIKRLGGKPFLTDCNTLYVGYRNNALNHLDAAYMNGYNPLATGVHTIIADGLRGTDERAIPVAGGEYVKEAKIGAAVAEADIIISLTHFKGHINAGFGGTLKNIGMGCGSKQGKMEMHSSGTPHVSRRLCVGCGNCVKNCANDGVHVVDGKAVVDEEHCLGCGYCIAYCPTGAIMTKWDEAKPVMNKKIAEYTNAAPCPATASPPCWTASPISISVWWWTCRLSATATVATTSPSSPMWACLHRSTLWHWTRPASTKPMHSPWCRAAWREKPQNTTTTRMCSIWCIPTPTGRQDLSTPNASASAPESMS